VDWALLAAGVFAVIGGGFWVWVFTWTLRRRQEEVARYGRFEDPDTTPGGMSERFLRRRRAEAAVFVGVGVVVIVMAGVQGIGQLLG
jgi:hypothetical protein